MMREQNTHGLTDLFILKLMAFETFGLYGNETDVIIREIGYIIAGVIFVYSFPAPEIITESYSEQRSCYLQGLEKSLKELARNKYKKKKGW